MRYTTKQSMISKASSQR